MLRFDAKPAGKTTDSKTDFGEIVHEINELAVFNDEAHHIHNPKMAWFKSILELNGDIPQWNEVKDVNSEMIVDLASLTASGAVNFAVTSRCDGCYQSQSRRAGLQLEVL